MDAQRRILENHSIVIEKGRIAEIGKTSDLEKKQKSAEILDALWLHRDAWNSLQPFSPLRNAVTGCASQDRASFGFHPDPAARLVANG